MTKKSLTLTNATPEAGHVITLLAAALSLAALSNQNEQPLGVAACSFEIDIEQPWQQILPGTDFSAADGRPFDVPGKKWKINNASGAALAALLNANQHPIVVDYEHATLLSKETGSEAPAAAWPKKFEWRDNEGLFAQLNFTPKARDYVKNKEYRFYSPVVVYEKDTGTVVDLHSIALTNDPAIKNMADAAALKSQPTSNPPSEKTMNEGLQLLLSFIGVTSIDTTKDVDAAALKAALESKAVATKLAELKAKVESNNEQTTQIAALKAQLSDAEKAQGIDPSKYVPAETYNAVINEMAALKADHETVTVDQVIEQAKKDGKFIAEAEVGYLKDLGKANMAALKANLDGRVTIAALSGKKQTTEQKPDEKTNTGTAALTSEQKLVADQLGITHEEFAKDLAKDK